jgi:hypothetical protein
MRTQIQLLPPNTAWQASSAEAGAIKTRLKADTEFAVAVSSWDDRRKRIEARLDSQV